MTKVLISGGRDFIDQEFIFDKLFKFHTIHNITKIVNGGARGVDSISSAFADKYDIEKEIYIPDWETYGKAAGTIRNGKMLYLTSPDYVIIFPGGNGTDHMKKIAKNSGYIVIEYHNDIITIEGAFDNDN